MTYVTQQLAEGSLKIVETGTDNVVLHADSDSRVSVMKTFSIARTDTDPVNGPKLPAGAVITRVEIYSGTSVNNVDTATLSLGKVSGSVTDFLNAVDVKTAGQLIPAAAGLYTVIDAVNPIRLTAVYAETGTASTVGGPFHITVYYYMSE